MYTYTLMAKKNLQAKLYAVRGVYLRVCTHIPIPLYGKKKLQAKLYAVRGVGDARARALCDLDQGYFDLYVKGDVLM